MAASTSNPMEVSMKYFHSLISVALTAVLLFSACSDDDPVTPESGNGAFTVTGTVSIKPGMTVPETAKLSAIWSISSGSPDYAYVFGRGSVDLSTMTFSITFDATPPPLALNDYSSHGAPSLGVGYIALADFTTLEPHMLTETESKSVYGAVMNMGVIYIGGDPAKFNTGSEILWPAAFVNGYAMGEGKETSEMFDIFVRTTATSFVLRITDDQSEFKFPNWT